MCFSLHLFLKKKKKINKISKLLELSEQLKRTELSNIFFFHFYLRLYSQFLRFVFLRFCESITNE